MRMIAIVLAVLALEGADASVQLSTVARDGRVFVSCTLTDGLVAELDEAIRSGLATTFTYDAELRRPVSIWLDRSIASATVATTVQRDTLTGRYQLSRSIDGRIEDSRVTDDTAVMKQFATAFDRLALFSTADLEPNTEYYVRVRIRTRPRVTWFFWPWDRGLATGYARFTFIP